MGRRGKQGDGRRCVGGQGRGGGVGGSGRRVQCRSRVGPINGGRRRCRSKAWWERRHRVELTLIGPDRQSIPKYIDRNGRVGRIHNQLPCSRAHKECNAGSAAGSTGSPVISSNGGGAGRQGRRWATQRRPRRHRRCRRCRRCRRRWRFGCPRGGRAASAAAVSAAWVATTDPCGRRGRRGGRCPRRMGWPPPAGRVALALRPRGWAATRFWFTSALQLFINQLPQALR